MRAILPRSRGVSATASTLGAVSGAPFVDSAGRLLGARFVRLSLVRQVISLSIWPLLEQLLKFLVTFVDTVQSGHLNADAVAAVGIAGYVVWALGLVQSAAGIGSTAIVARAVGEGHRRLVNATLGQSLLLAVVAGIITGGVLFLFAPLIGQFIELSGPSLEYSTRFLRVLALATPMSFLLFVGCACLRGAGDTRTPFQIMIVVNVVNVAGNCTFVLAPMPLGQHGVAGIAFATGLAWTLGALVMIARLLSGRCGIRLYLHRLVWRWPLVKRITRIGLPNLVEASGVWIAQFLVLKIIGHVGQSGVPDAVGIHSVAVRIEGISYLPGLALSVAAATLAGQYLGMRAPDCAKRAVRICWLAGVIIMGTMGALFLLVPHALVAIVTNDPVILRSAPTLLRICGPSEIFLGTYLVLSQAMRGAGETRTPMYLTYFSIFGLRLTAAYLLGVVLDQKLVGIWFALCGEVVFRGLLFAAWFWRGQWTEAKV